MNCKTMVLITKVEGYFIGIELVEVVCKVCISIINSRLQFSITLHDSLHSFIQVWVTGTATLEEKLDQQLAGIFYKPIFKVFLDVLQAYNSLA